MLSPYFSTSIMENQLKPFRTKKIVFLGEQDGPAERELKFKLAECLSSYENVDSAFLARISLREISTPQVALCLNGGENNALELVECVGKVFGRLFKTTQHLEVVFLTKEQLEEIKRVAKSFYPSLCQKPIRI